MRSEGDLVAMSHGFVDGAPQRFKGESKKSCKTYWSCRSGMQDINALDDGSYRSIVPES